MLMLEHGYFIDANKDMFILKKYNGKYDEHDNPLSVSLAYHVTLSATLDSYANNLIREHIQIRHMDLVETMKMLKEIKEEIMKYKVSSV